MTDLQKLYIEPSSTSPEIILSPDENIFKIHGVSAPEDVRALYYPVIEWLTSFVDNLIENGLNKYTSEEPLKFQIDMYYFNSSSAKFIYDIVFEIKRLIPYGVPVVIEWFYEDEDLDLKEAGIDIALLADMQFTYIPKYQ